MSTTPPEAAGVRHKSGRVPVRARSTTPTRLAQRRAGQKAFLAAYAELGNITQAAKAAKMARALHYEWMGDPEYVAAFERAEQEATDALEAAARQRAIDGVLEPVVSGGKLVYGEDGKPLMVRKFSDRLTEVLLRAHRPEKFREQRNVTVTGPDGGPVELEVRVTAVTDRLRELRAGQAAVDAASRDLESDAVGVGAGG